MDSSADDDDPRAVELETLAAIYPEMAMRRDAGRFGFELELPVQPAEPVTVLFPAAPRRDDDQQQQPPAAEPVDSLLVSHLPSLRLRITLPDGYPATRPLEAAVSTTPPWLPASTLAGLERDGLGLWEEAGRDLVAYAYVDHVQRAAEHVFGAVTARGALEVDPAHKLAVLDYDIKAKRAAFEKETFECGICLDPKKGSRCHKMVDCGHIFCLQCLRDFYNDAVEQGNLSFVRCLTPNCAKERAAAAADGGPARPGRKAKDKALVSPSELLQMGLSEETVKRYVSLRYKTELESDKDTVYCPRQWCSGAARSKKHKKPEGLAFADTSDPESEHEDGGAREEEPEEKAGGGGGGKFNPADLLCVCDDCGFAFCSRCLQTWHGEFVRCAPRRNKDELTEEEKARRTAATT
ncbi:hypothetical protein CDD83_3334 [Cordyceps sp. RAO-2017]|nr:hypothetical protein CDD83_3334 [Cordyceps sp. RAO-2017]